MSLRPLNISFRRSLVDNNLRQWFHLVARVSNVVVGGYPKIQIRSPNTREESIKVFKSKAQMTQEQTKNPIKTTHASKVVNPFTRALAPPFIGRRRDFYIPKVPSNVRNIPNVNMYMNVFYILYIYKPATSSHVKPGLLRRRL
jgi:hypothetical protein